MYQILDSLDAPATESLGRFDHEVPEPLEHWTLDDFSDLVSVGGYAS